MTSIVNDENSRYWTEAEVAYLKKNYCGYGTGPKCAKYLNKPINLVNEKARLLGLSKNCPDWTEAEIEILYKYYPIEGDKVYLRIPLHSKDACRGKAKQLKIRTKNHYWTPDEISILKLNFPLVGPTGCSKLLNRNKTECKHKADRLGLIYTNNPQKVWTDEKLKLLLENKDAGISKLIQILGISRGCIYKKLKEISNG